MLLLFNFCIKSLPELTLLNEFQWIPTQVLWPLTTMLQMLNTIKSFNTHSHTYRVKETAIAQSSTTTFLSLNAIFHCYFKQPIQSLLKTTPIVKKPKLHKTWVNRCLHKCSKKINEYFYTHALSGSPAGALPEGYFGTILKDNEL